MTGKINLNSLQNGRISSFGSIAVEGQLEGTQGIIIEIFPKNIFDYSNHLTT